MEGEIYKHDTCGKAGIRAPACYFAAHDKIPNRILILMEDMAPLRAADQARPPTPWPVAAARSSERTDCVGQAVGLTAEEAKATIREISKLHAEYWGCAQEKAPHIKTIGETPRHRSQTPCAYI